MPGKLSGSSNEAVLKSVGSMESNRIKQTIPTNNEEKLDFKQILKTIFNHNIIRNEWFQTNLKLWLIMTFQAPLIHCAPLITRFSYFKSFFMRRNERAFQTWYSRNATQHAARLRRLSSVQLIKIVIIEDGFFPYDIHIMKRHCSITIMHAFYFHWNFLSFQVFPELQFMNYY